MVGQLRSMARGLRDDELDDAFVYGSTRLGNEIAHAFDSEGRLYDANGNRCDWWTAEDAASFDKRAPALIEHEGDRAVNPTGGLSRAPDSSAKRRSGRGRPRNRGRRGINI